MSPNYSTHSNVAQCELSKIRYFACVRSLNSKIIFFIVLLVRTFSIDLLPTHADSEAPNVPNIQTSRYSGYYAKSIPAEVTGTKGETRIFRVGKKKDVLIQKYPWYASQLYLEAAPDGVYVVRLGPWSRGYEASSDDLALEFYKNDRWLKSYFTLELAGNPGNVSRSISHYTVIKEYRGFSHDGELTVFGITLIDGREVNFNAETGEIILPQDNRPPEEVINDTPQDVQTKQPAQKVTVGNNQLLELKVVRETKTSLDVEIEYNYEPQGEDWANLSAGLLRQGEHLPFTGFVPAQLVAGHHKAVIMMNLTGDAPDCFTSGEIEITMYRKRGYEFLSDLAKRVFPYERIWERDAPQRGVFKNDAPRNSFLEKIEKILPSSWKSSLRSCGLLPDIPESEADRGTGPGYGRIGQVKVIRDTNDTLELEVHYVYDPQQSRFAELSAATYLEKGSPNHDKRLPVHVQPGFNTASLKIERSFMAPARYETNRVRIVLVGNFLTDDPNNRLFVGETFIYPKTWSQSPIPEEAKSLAGQALVREGTKEESRSGCDGGGE